jgi:hypothetical protein
MPFLVFFFFFFYNIGDQEGGQILQGMRGTELPVLVVGEATRKGGRRMNTVQKMCTHECKCTNITYWKYFRNGGWVIKVEGMNSRMMHLIHCKNFNKCHNIPPPSTTIQKKKKKNVF